MKKTHTFGAGPLRLRSAVGCQQGDPLGPLFFSLALHDFMTGMARPPGADQHRQMFYLDDGVAVGPHATLRNILVHLASDEAVAYGFHLRSDKSELWWPTPPSQEDQAAYPQDLPQSFSEGTDIMRAPVGSDEYVRQALTARVTELKPLLTALASLGDAHSEFTLLRSCLSVSRVTFLLRVTPTLRALPAAELFDSLLAEALREMIGGVLPERRLGELRLPVRTAEPAFGVGLSCAASTASAAYLASLLACRQSARASCPAPPQPGSWTTRVSPRPTQTGSPASRPAKPPPSRTSRVRQA